MKANTDPLDPQPFLRSLSHRELTTSGSLVLLVLALYSLLDFYFTEHWIVNNYSAIRLLILSVIIPINHVIYKTEHHRRNNFIGRGLHDLIFILIFLGATEVYNLLLLSASNDPSTVASIFIAAVFFTILLEFGVSALRRILSKLGWDIL